MLLIVFFSLKVFGSCEVYDAGLLSHFKADVTPSVAAPRDHTAAVLSEDTPIVTEGDKVTMCEESQRSGHCCVMDFMREKRNPIFESKLKEIFDAIKTQTAKENLLLSLRSVSKL